MAKKNQQLNYMNKVFRPMVAVDMLIFTVTDNKLKVLLVKRGIEPFKNKWAIPGGFIFENETLEESAKRELKEETGVTTGYLEQLYTFGEPKRDPRGRVISVSYFALIPASKTGTISKDADTKEAKWFSVDNLPKLAFDHKKIVTYALKRLQWKLEYTNVAYSILEDEFTLTDLQKVYEIVFGRPFDKRNFRKKIMSLNLVEPTGKKVVFGVHRPAKTYRFIRRKLSFAGIA